MRYAHRFSSTEEYNQARENDYSEPWVSAVTGQTKPVYNKTVLEKMEEEYLTFDILTDGYINWKKVSSAIARTIKYSKNGGSWTSISAAATINVVTGDKVRFKSSSPYFYDYDDDDYWTFNGTTCQFNLYGNIMSMEYEDDFKGKTLRTGDNHYSSDFGALFSGTSVIDASNLIIPDASGSYAYYYLFNGCTSLINPPKLPAATLNQYCYIGMFKGCTGLTMAPELLALTPSSNSYNNMFMGCSGLNYVKIMSTVAPPAGFLTGVSAAGTFVMNKDAQWDPAGIVPAGWTVMRV